MILGFTGRRDKPSRVQELALWDYFNRGTYIAELHHGGCVGADTLAHATAVRRGLPIIVHPPTDRKLVDVWATTEVLPGVRVLPPKKYLDRNHDIVDACDRLYAMPSGPERMRGSGTWATIRYARKVGKPVVIVYPDGKVEN